MSQLKTAVMALILLLPPVLGAANLKPLAPPSLEEKSAEMDELGLLGRTMMATEASLNSQKLLYELLQQLRTQQDRFQQDETNLEAAFSMMRLGHEALELIADNHFEPLISRDFLRELQVLDQMTHKEGISRP